MRRETGKEIIFLHEFEEYCKNNSSIFVLFNNRNDVVIRPTEFVRKWSWESFINHNFYEVEVIESEQDIIRKMKWKR